MSKSLDPLVTELADALEVCGEEPYDREAKPYDYEKPLWAISQPSLGNTS